MPVSKIAILLVAFAMAPTGALAQDGAEAIKNWLTCLSNSLRSDHDYTVESKLETPSAGVYDASITTQGKTLDRHGLLRLKWDQRQVVSFRILETNGENNEYLLSDVEGYVELKAPWGAWHLERDRTPDLSLEFPRIGTSIPAVNDPCSATDWR